MIFVIEKIVKGIIIILHNIDKIEVCLVKSGVQKSHPSFFFWKLLNANQFGLNTRQKVDFFILPLSP